MEDVKGVLEANYFIFDNLPLLVVVSITTENNGDIILCGSY